MHASIVLCRLSGASPGGHLLLEQPLETGALGTLEMGEVKWKETKLKTNQKNSSGLAVDHCIRL